MRFDEVCGLHRQHRHQGCPGQVHLLDPALPTLPETRWSDEQNVHHEHRSPLLCPEAPLCWGDSKLGGGAVLPRTPPPTTGSNHPLSGTHQHPSPRKVTEDGRPFRLPISQAGQGPQTSQAHRPEQGRELRPTGERSDRSVGLR